MHVRAALLRFSSASLGGGCLSSPISYTQRPTRPPPHPPGPGPAGHSLPRPAVSSRRSRSSSSSRAAAAAPGPSSSPSPPPPRSPRSPRAEEGAAEGGRTGPSSSGGGTRTNSAPRGSARPAGRLPSLRSSLPPRPPSTPPPPRPRALPASARTSPWPAPRGRRVATRPVSPPPPDNRPTAARGGWGKGAEPLVAPGVTAILGSPRLREDKGGTAGGGRVGARGSKLKDGGALRASGIGPERPRAPSRREGARWGQLRPLLCAPRSAPRGVQCFEFLVCQLERHESQK